MNDKKNVSVIEPYCWSPFLYIYCPLLSRCGLQLLDCSINFTLEMKGKHCTSVSNKQIGNDIE